MSGGGKSKEVTVGYHYYMNMHFSLAHGGVDELLEIRVGDRTAWAGSLTSGSAMVNQPNLFGGEKREGGVLGFADFMPGGQSQPVNPSLRSAIARATGSTDVPAYRGLTTIFFKGFDNIDMTGTPWDTTHKGIADNTPVLPSSLSVKDVFNYLTQVSNWKKLARSAFLWSSMNPYFKPPEFLVRRVWKGWYPEKAKIGEHVNPIHIIYECLTNKVWGLGYPSQDIDDSSFRAAADRVYNEGFGLSMKWTNQTRVQEFIELVSAHINANLVEDRQTGLWRMIMVRDDHDVNTLFELNESNCVVETFQRKTLGETINEVTVAYTRPDDGSTDTVTVQDLANFSNIGQINSQKKEYPGINDPDLAFKVALRDLNTLSKPVAKFTIRCNRDIIGHYPGDVVKVNWPRLGLNGVVIRIGTMDLGNLHKGEIQLEAIEDVFGLPQSTYANQQPMGWVDPARNPEPVTDQKLYELSFYELHTSTSSADRADWPEDVGFVAVSAKAPNTDSTTLTLHDNVDGEVTGNGQFTPQLTLTQPTERLDRTLHVDFDGFDVLLLLEGGLAWLGDELIEVTDFDTAASTITVNRAVVDTTPVKHSAGEVIWFYQVSDFALDNELRVAGEVVDYRLLTETSKGQLDPSMAPVVSYQLQNRQARPYPPGDVKTYGEYFAPVHNADQGVLSLSWVHRDRQQQLAGVPHFLDGNIGDGTERNYLVKVWDEDGVQVVSETLPATTVYEFTDEAVLLNKMVPHAGEIFRRQAQIDDQERPYLPVAATDKGFFLVRPDQTDWVSQYRLYDSVDGNYLSLTETFDFSQISSASHGYGAFFPASGATITLNGVVAGLPASLQKTTASIDHWALRFWNEEGLNLRQPDGTITRESLPTATGETVVALHEDGSQAILITDKLVGPVQKQNYAPTMTDGVEVTPVGDAGFFVDSLVKGPNGWVVGSRTAAKILTCNFGQEVSGWTAINLPSSGIYDHVGQGPAGEFTIVDSSLAQHELMISTDNGQTWNSVFQSQGEIHSVTWSGTRILVSGDEGIVYSDDNGSTWSNATSGVPGKPVFVETNGTDVFAVNNEPATNRGIYKSTDNGVNWSLVHQVNDSSVIVDVSRSQSHLLAVGRPSENIWGVHTLVSSDGGDTWQETYGGTHMNTAGSEVANNYPGVHPRGVVNVNGYWLVLMNSVTASGRAYLTGKVGSTALVRADSNIQLTGAKSLSLIGVHQNRVVALSATDFGEVYDVTNGTHPYTHEYRIQVSNDLKVWSQAVVQSFGEPAELQVLRAFITSEANSRFNSIMGLKYPMGLGSYYPVFCQFAGRSYLGGPSTDIFMSTDLENWTPVQTPLRNHFRVNFQHVRVMASTPTSMIALVATIGAGNSGEEFEIWRTTDGQTFNLVHSVGHVPGNEGSGTYDHALVTENGFILYGSSGIIVSEDDGQSWQERETYHTPCAAYHNGVLMVAQGGFDESDGSSWVKFSTDKGVTWNNPSPEDNPSSEVVSLPDTYRINDELNVQLDVEQNGLNAYQQHDFGFKRAGYGYRYGEYYGGR